MLDQTDIARIRAVVREELVAASTPLLPPSSNPFLEAVRALPGDCAEITTRHVALAAGGRGKAGEMSAGLALRAEGWTRHRVRDGRGTYAARRYVYRRPATLGGRPVAPARQEAEDAAGELRELAEGEVARG